MTRLDGKVAVVTGASSGIGKAIAIRLASEGAKVVTGARRTEKLEGVVQKIKQNGGEAIAVTCDVTIEEDIEKLIKTAVDSYGGLHVAVNNAGIGGKGPLELTEFSAENFDLVYNTNVRATFLGLKHEIPAMNGSGPGGSIINVSSVLGSVALTKLQGWSIYQSSKAAIDMITRMAAIENPTLRVNAISPGAVVSEATSGISTEMVAKLQFIGRFGEAEEVASLVAFLASDEASFMTGSIYRIDGGFALTGS